MATEQPRADRRRRLPLIATAAILLAIIAAVVWVGVRALLAREELADAVTSAGVVRDAVADDPDVASRAAAELARQAASAASLTSDPVWRVAEIVPWIGDDLAAVRTMSAELSRVADDAIVPVVALGTDVGSLVRPVDGRLPLDALQSAHPVLADAADALAVATDRVAEIGGGALLDPVARAHIELADALRVARDTIDPIEHAARLLPTVLGADGPRSYLVLFQNNAELRTGGGIVGALALVRADAGRLELVEQTGSGGLRPTAEPVLPLDQADIDLFGVQLGCYIQNVTATPDFAFAAGLASEFWRTQRGGEVDGVISVDPVGLGYLLAATGPVTLPNGDVLDAGNAVRTLLVDAYVAFDEEEQDAYFAQAAASVFDAIAAGGYDPTTLLSALQRAAAEHRIAVWSAHPDEQAVLAGTTLAGLQATQDALGAEAYAVYLNDRTGGKMGAYLDVQTSAAVVGERADGRSEVAVTVTITNTAPADAATYLPVRVTNNSRLGVPAGVAATNVAVYAPPGAYDLGVVRDGTAVGYRSVDVGDRIANNVAIDLAPGATQTVEYRFLSAEAGQRTPVLLGTPLMTR